MQLQNNESWCFTGSKDFRSLVALSSQYSLLYNPESEAERLSEGCFLLSSDWGIKPFLCKSRKTGINTLTVSNKGTSPELSPALNVHLCLVDWQHNKTWQENRWQFLFCDEGMRALHRYLGNGVMAHTSGACSEGAFAAWLELTVGSFGSVFLAPILLLCGIGQNNGKIILEQRSQISLPASEKPQISLSALWCRHAWKGINLAKSRQKKNLKQGAVTTLVCSGFFII